MCCSRPNFLQLLSRCVWFSWARGCPSGIWMPINSSAPFTMTSRTAVPNGALLFRPAPDAPTPNPNPTSAMLYQGMGLHGRNLFSTTDHHVTDPSVIESSNVGFRFENSDLYSGTDLSCNTHAIPATHEGGVLLLSFFLKSYMLLLRFQSKKKDSMVQTG